MFHIEKSVLKIQQMSTLSSIQS